MNISGMISNAKNRFRDAQVSRDKERLMLHNLELQKERDRQGELVKLNAEKQRLENDVKNINSFNSKGEQPKSNLRKLGEGMSRFLSKEKERVRTIRKEREVNVGSSNPFSNMMNQGQKAEQNSPFRQVYKSPFVGNKSSSPFAAKQQMNRSPFAANQPVKKERQIKKVVFYK